MRLQVWKGSILLFIILNVAFKSNAQEPIGLINDNYLPSSTALYNPASVFTSPLDYDINLVSLDLFAYNNLAYAKHTSLLTLLNNNISTDPVSYNLPNSIRGYTRATVQGPSVIFNRGTYTLGILTQVRSATSVVTTKLSSDLDLNNLMLDTSYSFPSAKAAGMNWMEIGIHLGKSLYSSGPMHVYGAFNLNYLAGWDGISATTEQPLDFTWHNSDTISFNHVAMNYGYTSGLATEVSQNLTSLQIKGSGASINAGILITDENNGSSYRWKAGFSLIDVGVISFSKNVQQYSITTDTTVFATEQDFNALNSVDDFTQLASEVVNGKGNMQSVGGPLNIWLPAALSFQGEISLPRHFFYSWATCTTSRGFITTGAETQQPDHHSPV